MTAEGLGLGHQKVKRLRLLVRRRRLRAGQRAFVIEGPNLIAEALAAGIAVESVFVAPGGEAEPVLAQALASGARVHRLGGGVLERVAGTVTPQPVIAVARWCDVALADVRDPTLVVVCAEVRDPGNAGTVLRSAEAAGADAVVFCDGSVDVFNPKCVRASAGSLFHVPVVAGGDGRVVLEEVGRRGLRRLATVAAAGAPYDQVDLTVPVAVVVGNEAHGLPDGLRPGLDGELTIPMAGRTQSLNVGMAAAVICFEAQRQRRAGPGWATRPRAPYPEPAWPPRATPPQTPPQ
ncbi:MAG: TrmH family RNA methyltransferase [Acidimicrobiales bacterium]